MSAQRLPEVTWQKSSYSGSGNCVEVGVVHDTVVVRDSKRPDQPVLQFTADEWAAFVSGIRAGEFGRPRSG